MNCPHCNQPIPDKLITAHFGSMGGKMKSKRKAHTSRANGKKGGRPRKATKGNGDV